MPVPPMRGHLPCRDTFAWIQKCPLKAGTTVNIIFTRGHQSPTVECVRLIIGSFCWVDYLANKGCRTSLLVILSHDRIHFHVLFVRTVVNILFIRNPYMFLMTSRYSESLVIGT